MNISNWRIYLVWNEGDYWRIRARFSGWPTVSEEEVKNFFSNLFGGNKENYLALGENGLNYSLKSYNVVDYKRVDIWVRKDPLDYEEFPCFMSWTTLMWQYVENSTTNIPGYGPAGNVWFANYSAPGIGDRATIAIGDGSVFTTSPFDLANALTTWHEITTSYSVIPSSPLCSETETTIGITIKANPGAGSYYIAPIARLAAAALFTKGNYVKINNNDYLITKNSTYLYYGDCEECYYDGNTTQLFHITVQKRFAGESLCNNATSIKALGRNTFIEPEGGITVFEDIFKKKKISKNEFKVFYDFTSYNSKAKIFSKKPVEAETWSGTIFGNAQEFLGFNLDQYELGASGTGFFRSGLHGYDSPAPEVSAVAYNPLKNTLFINEDDAGTTDNQYTERALDGSWIRTITSNIQDSEGMCYMTGQYFAIASEQSVAGGANKIYYGTINDSINSLDAASMYTITLDTVWGDGEGLEGITFDENNDCFYGAREGDATNRGVYRIDFDGTTTKRFGPTSITDFAGLHYDPGLQNFFVLSQEDKKVYHTDFNGNVISQKSIPMNQPEGIAFTSGLKRMYIGGEPCEGGYWDLYLSGYACFDRKRYVKIENSTGLYAPSWTMMFACTKKDNDPSLLFSNFGGYTQPSSGFAIGINCANRLYFENYAKNFSSFRKQARNPGIKTLASHSAKENIYCIIGNTDRQTLTLGRYDLGMQGFDFQEYPISDEFFERSDNWYLGTGTAIAADNYNYDGCMDYFLYFKSALDFDQADAIASGMYSQISGVVPNFRSAKAEITGYSGILTGVTGIIGYKSALSGVREVVYSGVSVTGTGLFGEEVSTGFLNLFITGDPYTGLYTNLQNNIFEQKVHYTGFYNLTHSYPQTFSSGVFISGDSVTSITGFKTGYSGYYYTGYENVYTGQVITGYLYSGYKNTPLFDADSFQTLSTSGNVLLPTTKIYNYFYDSLSYINRRINYGSSTPEKRDLVDITHRNWNINKPAYIDINWGHNYTSQGTLGYSNEVSKPAFSLSNEHTYKHCYGQSGKVNLFLNGIAQHQGLSKNTKARNDFDQNTFMAFDGDYSLEGGVLQDLVNDFCSGGFYDASLGDDVSSMAAQTGFFTSTKDEDQLLFDITEERLRQRTGVTDAALWSPASITAITGQDAQVFLNGIKLYSGLSYEVDANRYVELSSPANEVTGYMTTFPEFYEPEFTSKTGWSLYDITGHFIGRSMYYLNGVRQDSNQFIYWASGVSLITGVNHVLSGDFKELYRKEY